MHFVVQFQLMGLQIFLTPLLTQFFPIVAHALHTVYPHKELWSSALYVTDLYIHKQQQQKKIL